MSTLSYRCTPVRDDFPENTNFLLGISRTWEWGDTPAQTNFDTFFKNEGLIKFPKRRVFFLGSLPLNVSIFGHTQTLNSQSVFLIPSASSSSWHWSKCMASDAPDLHKEPVNRPTNQLARSLLDVSICLTRVFRAQPRFMAAWNPFAFLFSTFQWLSCLLKVILGRCPKSFSGQKVEF